MKQIFNLHMVTPGSGTGGTFDINSELFYSTVASIVIPKGMEARVTGWKVSGAAATLNVATKRNATASEVILATHKYDPTLDGSVNFHPITPITVKSDVGTEYVYFTWAQTSAAVTYFDVDLELVPTGE